MSADGSEDHTALFRARAARVTPGGVHSNVRLSGPQRILASGSGARLHDVNGRDYVDYVLGQGPNFLGHSPAAIRTAVAKQVEDGLLLGGQTTVEIEAAEAFLAAVKWPEMVRFGVSGTEAVHGAVRLARAVTDREYIVRFEGHYHGWLDSVLNAPSSAGWGVASAGQLDGNLSKQLVLPWNDTEVVDHAFAEHGASIAAVVTEPMMVNAGAIEPRPGYLAHLREACDANGSVLIFDEVITGFRLALGGAVERYGVTPDLATYGKALAAGWPVAAIAGRADLMAEFGTGRVNHSGTFNGSVLSSAAVLATMRELQERPPYEQIQAYGTRLMTELPRIARDAGHQLRVQGLPAAFHASFGPPDVQVLDFRDLTLLDAARYQQLVPLLVEAGLWLTQRGVWYVSAAHREAELDDTLERFAHGISRLS